jgi:DNA-binding transcriptional MerR regulator
MEKDADAFRTISEVAEDLDLPQHVLRFWETRFAQIKPLKRAGGRRFYRPNDVEFLRGIKQKLYGEGYTIRGVQKILKEQGARAVSSLNPVAREDSSGPASLNVESPPPEAPHPPRDDPDLPLFQSALYQPPASPGPPLDQELVRNAAALESLRRILVDLEECEQILASARRA